MMHEQQRVWDTARTKRNLIRGHPQFARTGLMTELDEALLVVTVLPSDPLAPILDFDDDLLQVVPERFSGRTPRVVQLHGERIVTDDAVARVASGHGGMGAYVAIRRAGAVEVGIGSPVRYRQPNDAEPGPFIYRLHHIVHAVRIVIEGQARLLSRPPLSEEPQGPFELDVALSGTAGALLGGRADGWEDPSALRPDMSRCATEEVLVRTQFVEWPDTPDEQHAALLRVGDRVCNAFGTTQRWFAPPNGHPGAGQLSSDYA